MLSRLALALLLALLSSFAVLHAVQPADAAPQPPCAGSTYPAFPAVDASPNIALWGGAGSAADWIPPACTGWNKNAALVVAVAGRFTSAHDVDGMLARLGNISALTSLRYWSITNKKWDRLFLSATALSTPDPAATRTDFSAGDMRKGTPLYFLSTDNRSNGPTVSRFAIRESGPERITLEVTNISPVRWSWFVLVPPGGMQTLYFIERRSDNSWQFYSLSRTETSSWLSRFVSRESFINRAVAMYRHVAMIPTDRDPPAAP